MVTFPESWWKERPLVLGHRGASHAAPQNTLAAFRKAVEAGADGVELDVHLSRDGVPVVIHDAKVDATTDGEGHVSAMLLEELQALDAGRRFHPQFTGERIPTLEAVLREVGEALLVNIELKAYRSDSLVSAVVEVVRRLRMESRVWFSSFKPYLLYQARDLAPDVPCGLLYAPPTVGSLLLAPITPYEARHPYHAMVRERAVQRAHQRGLRVFTWTVDDVEVAQRLAAWGIDGIITNEPQKILAALAT